MTYRPIKIFFNQNATGGFTITLNSQYIKPDGTAWGLRGPFMQAIRADYFGRRSIGMIIGLSSMITVIGQIGGPILAGAFADWTGNYRMGFTILAVLAASGSLFFLMAKKPA